MRLPFNCVPNNTDPLPPMGEKIKPPAPPAAPEWKPVPGKPHTYEDKDGKWKYAPPEPKTSALKPATTEPAKPVQAGEWTLTKDRKPPKKGWYVASIRKQSNIKRYWDGKFWSQYIFINEQPRPRDRSVNQEEMYWKELP